MGNQISNWVSLTEVINTVKLRMGDLTNNDHYKIMSIAVSLIQEFNLHYRNTKKSVEIDPSGKQYIVLPDDFVDYIKIGFVAPNGEIFTLTKNDRLVDSLTMLCGEEYTWKEKQDIADACAITETTTTSEPIIIPSNLVPNHEKNFQKFTVLAGQTTFQVTDFVLSSNYLVFDDGGEQSTNTSRVGQIITFNGAVEDQIITILKLS